MCLLQCSVFSVVSCLLCSLANRMCIEESPRKRFALMSPAVKEAVHCEALVHFVWSNGNTCKYQSLPLLTGNSNSNSIP